ncbi:MAG: alpha/beta hydrolase [Sphingomonadales bacterium]|nr:alpha/beta hydrolase [Sphingomonadales bacterium]
MVPALAAAEAEAVSAARRFPPPTDISPAAQAYLRHGASAPPPLPIPAPGDVAGWKAYVAAGDAVLPVDLLLKLPVDSETVTIGSAQCHVLTPHKIAPDARRKVHLSIHGGGWILFGGKGALALGKLAALEHGVVTYAVDYRMPPDHVFPAGLEDCLAVYADLLKRYRPQDILVSGGSAGGNLAAALMLKARDAGLPKPAALILNTPVTDLTNGGDSWAVLDGLDVVLRDPGGVGSSTLYLNGNDPRSPYLSPLFGQLAGAFPPTHLITGTRDRLLSDTVRMHAALRAADVPADLYVVEAMPHGGFGGMAPEESMVRRDTRRWLQSYW